MTQRKEPLAQHAFYQDSLAHLVDELRRLDTLIQRHIATHRPQNLATQGMAASKGVYITHDEVDALLNQEDAADAQGEAVAWVRNTQCIIRTKATRPESAGRRGAPKRKRRRGRRRLPLGCGAYLIIGPRFVCG